MRNNVTTIEASIQAPSVLRVAAYCRVSSDSSDQLHSFAVQVQYYTKLIADNEGMELVDIYADEGITGTKTAPRDEFNRMVADCKKGKIDRILTRSISRFARNNVDALLYARMLKEQGVSILFEKENIDTAYMSSELLLTLSGAQAQDESVSISKNMRWSVEGRMKNGTYISSSAPYGYEFKDGNFYIVEEHAEIVRLIFKSFLSGMGKKAIAIMLNDMNAPKNNGCDAWRTNAVAYILSNERYIGDAIFQKSFKEESVPFKKKVNRGEKPKYYVEGTNPAIVSVEDYNAVQALLARRSRKKEQISGRYTLSKKIECPCGCFYCRLIVNEKAYWDCKQHEVLKTVKPRTRRIPEVAVYNAFIAMVNKLRNCRADILPMAISQTERLQMKASGVENKIREIDTQIAELNNKNLVLARLNSKGIVRPAEYAEQNNAINGKVKTLRLERRKLLQEQDDKGVLAGLKELNAIFADIDKPKIEMDEDLFGRIVEKITVVDDTTIKFHLLGGLTLSEKIPQKRGGARE